MEHLEGESLADRLSKGPLALDKVLKLGAQIADALDLPIGTVRSRLARARSALKEAVDL